MTGPFFFCMGHLRSEWVDHHRHAPGLSVEGTTTVHRIFCMKFSFLVAAIVLVTSVSVPEAAQARSASRPAHCARHGSLLSISIKGDDPMMALSRNKAGVIQLTSTKTHGGTVQDPGPSRPCGSPEATVHNIDRIVIDATNTVHGVDIDLNLTDGDFAPGLTREAHGISEIEMVVRFPRNGAANNRLVYAGSSRDDFYVLGTRGIALDRDRDLDLALRGLLAKMTKHGGYTEQPAYGGEGNDLLTANGGHGAGAPYPGPVDFAGGPGDDHLATSEMHSSTSFLDGNDGDDSLRGFAGSEVLVGGPGADLLVGGGGIDDAAYGYTCCLGPPTGVRVDLNKGTGSQGDAAGDRLSGIETVEGTSATDTLIGDNGPNLLLGWGGGDSVDGNGGDDLIQGEPGMSIDGGDGADTVAYDYVAHLCYSGAQVNLSTGETDGCADGDSLTNIENLWGTDTDDHLVGGDGANQLVGGGGADTINGGQGDDVESGGFGDDTFFQEANGNGADDMHGGDGSDTVDYSARTVPVMVTFDDQANDGQPGELDNAHSDIETARTPQG